MTECDICKILEHRETFHFVYEDDICFAILHESPAIPGQVLLIPKKHATILEELDDVTVKHLFIVSSKISSAIFDTLGAYGTNIILNNGTSAGQELPHVVLHVLPRKENDGLSFEWSGKKATEEELKTTQSMITTYSEMIFSDKDKLPEVKIKEEETADEEDYELKGLNRIP